MKNNISVVITTFNSADYIENCLKSVKWAEEIVVVDDGSTDNTLEIVKHHTKSIYHHKSVGYVEPTRNFALAKATMDWILLLDADERVPAKLAEKLQNLTLQSPSTVISLPRKNIIFGKWIRYTGWWPDYNIRFFRKGKVTWTDVIHSKPKITDKITELHAGEENALVHYNYETISQFIQKLDRYTTITANQKKEEAFKWQTILKAPFHEFLGRYFALKGYKDGLHGLVLSMLMAFYELVIYLKLWEKEKFFEVDEKTVVKEFKIIRKSQRELRYWFNTKQIDEASNYFKKFLFKTKRKVGF